MIQDEQFFNEMKSLYDQFASEGLKIKDIEGLQDEDAQDTEGEDAIDY